METTVLASEPFVRLGAFAGVFLVLAILELLAPRRTLMAGRGRRWPSNLGVVAFNTLLLRLIFPTAAVGVALLGEAQGWGLFHAFVVPNWFAVAISVLLLDLTIYFQHVLFHATPALWRVHRMHHTDLDFDVTTGLRFHPIEIILSAIIKLMAVAALGAPALAVVIFEVALNTTSMFSHSNLRISPRVDRILRWFLVTPDMHRVHHSILPRETNSNFGFNAPWWDRLFGTYRAQPAAGHEAMTIGIDEFRDLHELRLDHMLLQPFRGQLGRYPLGRRTDAR
jgi:sterol desaturase/sphingolipid hydroxylase (fatty acid hydroxylase superfamily)